jgi:hypothetical protein
MLSFDQFCNYCLMIADAAVVVSLVVVSLVIVDLVVVVIVACCP